MGYLEKVKMKDIRLLNAQNRLNAEGLPVTSLSFWDVKWGIRAFVIFSERRAKKFIMEVKRKKGIFSMILSGGIMRCGFT
jgi:hypothetical protein